MCERRSGNKELSQRLVCLSGGRHAIGRRLFFWGGICRIHCIERNVVVIWRRNVAPSLHFAPPPPKCEPTIRECQSITARWLRPRTWACWPTAVSQFDSSDLADGVFADAAYR